MEFNKIETSRIKELYLNFRKEMVRLRKGGMNEKDAKVKAFETIYDTNKEELNGAGLNFNGFFKVMEIEHTFWTSRGDKTAADYKWEEDEINGLHNHECEKCGKVDTDGTQTVWLTGTYGVCQECYDKMSNEEIEDIEVEYL